MEQIDRNEDIAKEINNKSRLSFFTRLSAQLGFIPNKENGNSTIKLIQPPKEGELLGKSNAEALDIIGEYANLQNAEDVKKLYDEWEGDTQNTYENIAERMDRLDALQYMYDNYTKVSAAVNETANEVALVTNEEVFQFTSDDSEWDEQTNELVNKTWEYNTDKLKEIARQLVIFGEAFEGNEVNNAGIVKKTLLKPSEIQEKLVFNPIEVVNFNQQKQGAGQSTGFTVCLNGIGASYSSVNTSFTPSRAGQRVYSSKSQLLSDYLDNLDNISKSQLFAKHLLGYRWMDNKMLAPWEVTHFAVNENASEFYPYGDPPLLPCLPFFKAYQRANGLADIRERLSLPFTVYEVNTGGANTLKSLGLVRRIKQQFLANSVEYEANTMDGPNICTAYWTSKDNITITRQSAENGNVEGKVKELEHLDSQITICTLVPPSYINPAAEGFQLSGKALIELSAPFRALVYNYRNIIINKVKEDVVKHYSYKGIQCPNFTVKLNVKAGIANEDYSSAVQTADAILEVVSKILGCSVEEIPEEILRDVYTKYTNLSITDLANYKKVYARQGKRKIAEEPLTQEAADASAVDSFGPDFGGGGGEPDFGGMEEAPAEDVGMEESTYRKRKKKLIEQRYKHYNENDSMLYLITSKLNTIITPNYTAKYFDVSKDLKEDIPKFFRKTRTRRALKEEVALRKANRLEEVQELMEFEDDSEYEILED